MKKYIKDNKLTGKIRDALQDYDKGYKTAGEIAMFYGVDIDILIYHVKKQNGDW